MASALTVKDLIAQKAFMLPLFIHQNLIGIIIYNPQSSLILTSIYIMIITEITE